MSGEDAFIVNSRGIFQIHDSKTLGQFIKNTQTKEKNKSMQRTYIQSQTKGQKKGNKMETRLVLRLVEIFRYNPSLPKHHIRYLVACNGP